MTINYHAVLPTRIIFFETRRIRSSTVDVTSHVQGKTGFFVTALSFHV